MWKYLCGGICFGSLNVPLNPKFFAGFYFQVKHLLGMSSAEREGRGLIDVIFASLKLNLTLILGWIVFSPEVFDMRLILSSSLGIYGMETRFYHVWRAGASMRRWIISEIYLLLSHGSYWRLQIIVILMISLLCLVWYHLFVWGFWTLILRIIVVWTSGM